MIIFNKLRCIATAVAMLLLIPPEALEASRKSDKYLRQGEVAEAKGFKIVLGYVGLTVTMGEEVQDNLRMKVLLLGVTLAMELTGVGTKLVRA